MKILRTPAGIRFGLIGEKGPAPLPTVFAFAGSIEHALALDDYNKCGILLHGQDCGPDLSTRGCLCVSVDLPCYGEDIHPGDSGDPSGTRVPYDWRGHLERGEPWLSGFIARAIAVLDHLVREGYTDPQRVAAYGHSRGAFMALHLAAADRRVRCVAAFAPLVDLLAPREFHGLEGHAPTQSLALIRHVDKLVGRSVWICIGNDDYRVDTDRVVAFARHLAKVTVNRGPGDETAHPPADVELHVLPIAGHGIHETACQEGAAWIASRLRKG